jgi:hypothetical protein
MFDFVRAQEDFSFFGSPCTLRDFSGTTSLLRFNMTSSQSLHLHVDRGLERHGYSWVPTDQGPGGPYQVDPTCQKPHRPASGPRDLIHNPRQPWKTTGDLIQITEDPPGLWRKLPLGRGATPPVGPRIAGSSL